MTLFFVVSFITLFILGILFGVRLVANSLHQIKRITDTEYLYFLDIRHLFYLIKKTYIDHEYPKI